MSPIIDDLRIDAEIPPQTQRPGATVVVTLRFSNLGTGMRKLFLIGPEGYRFGQSAFHLQSAWWAFNFVNNWSLLRFDTMSREIRARADGLQTAAFALRRRLEREVGAHLAAAVRPTDAELVAHVQTESNAFASHVVSEWWALAWTLVSKYSGGYETTGEGPGQQQAIGYPTWWLRTSDFATWPGDTFKPRVSSTEQLSLVDSSAARGFVRQAVKAATTEMTDGRSAAGTAAVAVGYVLVGMMLGAVMFAVVKRESRRVGYTPCD